MARYHSVATEWYLAISFFFLLLLNLTEVVFIGKILILNNTFEPPQLELAGASAKNLSHQ